MYALRLGLLVYHYFERLDEATWSRVGGVENVNREYCGSVYSYNNGAVRDNKY